MKKVVTEITYDSLDLFNNEVLSQNGMLINEFYECSANSYVNKYIFRGERLSTNELIPSALREGRIDEVYKLSGYKSSKAAITNALDQIISEDYILQKFYMKCDDNGLKIPTIKRLRYHNFTSGYRDGKMESCWLPDDYFELAGLAQHYGLPTRLIDWSFNFFTALYFAINNPDNKEGYCSIWAYKYNAYYSNFYNTADKLKVIIPEYSQNPNLRAQKGVFTHWQIQKNDDLVNKPVDRSPLNKLFEDSIRSTDKTDYSKAFYKINLPISFANHLYKHLSVLGIDGSTLFPGYDGIRKSITEDVKFIGL